jgi:peptidyl-prolyl cis-trans isomerase B (cyclophilin B)
VKHFFLLVLVVLFGASAACDNKQKSGRKTTDDDDVDSRPEPQELLKITGAKPVVEVVTSMGKFKLELFEEKAPITVRNFLGYVDDKFFDGTIFHRVISNFMVQGGGFEPGMREKRTGDPIKNEADNGIPNQRGTIAMARTSDANSATAQFFINVKDNAGLNREHAQDSVGYAVFGQVIDGMDVVDKIRRVRTGKRGGHDDVPVEDVVIQSIRRVDK